MAKILITLEPRGRKPRTVGWHISEIAAVQLLQTLIGSLGPAEAGLSDKEEEGS